MDVMSESIVVSVLAHEHHAVGIILSRKVILMMLLGRWVELLCLLWVHSL